jgi:glucokinase
VKRATHAIGVDVGGTKILAGVVTPDGEVLRRHERPTPLDSQVAVLAELEAAVEELLTDEVAAIGFGVPAPLDLAAGVVFESVNMPLANVALRDHMRRRFGLVRAAVSRRERARRRARTRRRRP